MAADVSWRRTLARDRHSGYGDTATQRGSGGDRAQRTARSGRGWQYQSAVRVWVPRAYPEATPGTVRYLAVSENPSAGGCDERQPSSAKGGIVFSALHREEGQGLAEYALILSLIAILAVAALAFFSGKLDSTLSMIGKSL